MLLSLSGSRTPASSPHYPLLLVRCGIILQCYRRYSDKVCKCRFIVRANLRRWLKPLSGKQKNCQQAWRFHGCTAQMRLPPEQRMWNGIIGRTAGSWSIHGPAACACVTRDWGMMADVTLWSACMHAFYICGCSPGIFISTLSRLYFINTHFVQKKFWQQGWGRPRAVRKLDVWPYTSSMFYWAKLLPPSLCCHSFVVASVKMVPLYIGLKFILRA